MCIVYAFKCVTSGLHPRIPKTQMLNFKPNTIYFLHYCNTVKINLRIDFMDNINLIKHMKFSEIFRKFQEDRVQIIGRETLNHNINMDCRL